MPVPVRGFKEYCFLLDQHPMGQGQADEVTTKDYSEDIYTVKRQKRLEDDFFIFRLED